MTQLVKHLLMPCSTSRPEDFDIAGALVELSAPMLKWMISVMKSFDPLADQLMTKSDTGEIPELDKLVFSGDTIDWLDSGAVHDALEERLQHDLSHIDLTVPLEGSGFEDMLVIVRDGQEEAIEWEHAPKDHKLPKISSWLQLIFPRGIGADFEMSKLNITKDDVYWTAYVAYGDAATVQVETYCLSRSSLEEMLKELEEGKGSPKDPKWSIGYGSVPSNLCGEPLFHNGLLVARCTQKRGTEHSHNDHTASEALALGLAAPTTEVGRIRGEDHGECAVESDGVVEGESPETGG